MDKDIDLLDIITAAPSVIVPMLVGIAIDSSWSVNLALLLCLTGSVLAEFLVALGFSWHSYGWLLSGRLLFGCCVGSGFVIADTIACQFNRKRRATTLGLIASFQTLAVSAGLGTQISNFTRDSLKGDYTKMNDVFLIISLMC
jgi:MFS family permease